MDKKNKIRIIQEILKNAEKDILSKVDEMPEGWDGVEMRQYVADYIGEHFVVRDMMSLKRKAEYRNERLIRNL